MSTAEMRVEFLGSMGSDLTVVNFARASFGRESSWAVPPMYETALGRIPTVVEPGRLFPGDARLIWFLANGLTSAELTGLAEKMCRTEAIDEAIELFHRIRRIQTHHQPFGHVQVSLRFEAPLFVARQLWKSSVGAAGGDASQPPWSEESRRYVDGAPEFYLPDGAWRAVAKNVKQGSAGLLPDGGQASAGHMASLACSHAAFIYGNLLELGVAPEQARMILPQNAMVPWVWTGSLLFFSRVCQLRIDAHAQLETQQVAREIAELVRPVAPVSWAALMGEKG